MLCAIYKSLKKADTYLYVNKREDFSDVPKPLLEAFGKPHFAMMLDLTSRTHLAQVDIDKVKTDLSEKGYFLQVPPPVENLLEMHLESQKKSTD